MCQFKPISPELRVAVKALAEVVEVSAGGPGYLVYAMLDPREPDPFEEYESKLVYVGMTKDIGTRIRRRYHEAFNTKSH